MTCGRGFDVSMITTLSARIRRRCTSSAGNACRLHKHRALQAADVDAELERVGAHHARDLSVPQAGLDLAPVKREIAGAISAHPFRRVEPRGQVLAQVAEHHLDLEAAAAEDYGLHAVADPWGRDSAGFG